MDKTRCEVCGLEYESDSLTGNPCPSCGPEEDYKPHRHELPWEGPVPEPW